jgi:hypothetical protein
VYATEALQVTVNVETLMCSVPTYYTLQCNLSHAVASIVDRGAKRYSGGDFVAPDAVLTISVTPDEGYTLGSYTVNGTQYTAQEIATVTVSGTVLIEAQAEVII